MDGRATALAIRKELKSHLAAMKASQPDLETPGLAVVLVGDRHDSSTYVRLKAAACRQIGFSSIIKALPDDVEQVSSVV